MDVVIRRFLPQDEKVLKACINELKNWESQFDKDYLTGEQAVQRLFEYIVEKDQINVAVVENEIVGFIAWEKQLKNDELILNAVDTLYVSDMVVLPKFRKCGVGQKLLSSVETEAKKAKIKYLKLIAFSKNDLARNLYLKYGFEDYETTMIMETSTGL